MHRSASAWLVAVIILSFSPNFSWSQPATLAPLQQAQEYYEQSRFGDAIPLLEGALKKNDLAPGEREATYELLARCYVKNGKAAQARQTFKSILNMDSNYEPDPVRMPPDELTVFHEAREEFKAEIAKRSVPEKSKPVYKRWYFWVGIAVATAAIILLLKDDKPPPADPELAPFPSPPPAPARVNREKTLRVIEVPSR